MKKYSSLFVPFAFLCAILTAVIIGAFSGAFVGKLVYADTAPTAAEEASLQAQLNEKLQEIAAEQQVLSAEQAKGKTLQGDINILDDQIKTAQLNIQAHDLAAQALGKDIDQKNDTINDLSNQIDMSQESLAQLIREDNEIDQFSLPDMVFSGEDLSDFFADVDSFDSIKQSIQVALGDIKQTKSDTEAAEVALTQQQLQQIDEKISIEAEQANIKAAEAQKATLLSLSKSQQQDYQSVIAVKQAQAAKIRAALFALRDTTSIPFGDALQYATLAQQQTGVPPSFLLAILTQESNLGSDVGSCYLTNDVTGAGIKATTGAPIDDVMKPSRDIQPFLQITAAVGRDPSSTRVSCPFSTGYGGAMGPAQFIPSTWVLFQDRIAAATGDATPDPWNPKDAFMAASIYLGDLGAGSSSYSAERNAACRYYSGRTCDSKSPANAFYGDDVMAKATEIQADMIDPLQGT
jgi:membrane-bound lytic murein transglycosylase B